MTAKMKFDGHIGSLAADKVSSVVYSKTYKGKGTKSAFEKFIKIEAKRQGVDILEIGEIKTSGRELEATVRFRSTKGIL